MDEVVPKPVNIEIIKEILDEVIQWIVWQCLNFDKLTN